jgi:predicted enzyme related to lactoylglutathione lyase
MATWQNREMIDMSSLVLFATDPQKTAAFYCALGVPLEDEDHGEGPVHSAAEIGSVHFAIYPAETPSAGVTPWRGAGSAFAGFYVDSLDDAVASVTALGAPLLAGHQPRPWGCRALAEDPDGRTVEINQRDHCREDSNGTA